MERQHAGVYAKEGLAAHHFDAPVLEIRLMAPTRSLSIGFSGKGNRNGEVIVLSELEVVEAVGDNGRWL